MSDEKNTPEDFQMQILKRLESLERDLNEKKRKKIECASLREKAVSVIKNIFSRQNLELFLSLTALAISVVTAYCMFKM